VFYDTDAGSAADEKAPLHGIKVLDLSRSIIIIIIIIIIIVTVYRVPLCTWSHHKDA